MITKNRRVTITLPASVLKDVDWLAPLEDMTRDELILRAIKRFLKPHLDVRKRLSKISADIKAGRESLSPVFDNAEEMLAHMKRELKKRPYRITKAISESTEQFKTGRYDAPQE